LTRRRNPPSVRRSSTTAVGFLRVHLIQAATSLQDQGLRLDAPKTDHCKGGSTCVTLTGLLRLASGTEVGVGGSSLQAASRIVAASKMKKMIFFLIFSSPFYDSPFEITELPLILLLRRTHRA
jgi:hypothetical protein